MTCIVGVIHEGTIHLGSDSAATGGWGMLDLVAGGKLFRNGEFIFGCSGSPRVHQVLQYVFEPPRHHREVVKDEIVDRDIQHFMVADVIPRLRAVLHEEEALTVRNNTPELSDGSALLIGYRGHLFTLYSDLQVQESTDDFAAVGSGGHIAIGSLHMTREQTDPQARLEQALEAACRYNAYCRPPYHFLSV